MSNNKQRVHIPKDYHKKKEQHSGKGDMRGKRITVWSDEARDRWDNIFKKEKK